MTDTGAPRTTRLVLADDHDLVRAGIRRLLDRIEGVEVLAEASDGEQLVAAVDTYLPDVVVTDLSMPGMDGFEAIERIRGRHPNLPIVVLSMNNTPAYVRRAVAAGACGYLMKDAAVYELEQCIRGVLRDGHYFVSTVAALLLKPSEPSAAELLTGRQLEVLGMLAHGDCSKEIGAKLGLSPKTVDVHRARIMDLLQLHEVASLTRYAVREGLVTP